MSIIENNLTIRRDARSLESFLKHDFTHPGNKTLFIRHEKILGKVYSVLERRVSKGLPNLIEGVPYLGRTVAFFQDDHSLASLATFVQDNAPRWLPKNETEQLKLERNCALLDRKVKAHNASVKRESDKIAYKNPFQKQLNLVLQFTGLVDGLRYSVTNQIPFDCLTSQEELNQEISHRLSNPVQLQVPCRYGAGEQLYQFNVVTPLSKIFRHVVHSPMINPAKEKKSNPCINFIYSDPDQTVINMLMLKTFS